MRFAQSIMMIKNKYVYFYKILEITTGRNRSPLKPYSRILCKIKIQIDVWI